MFLSIYLSFLVLNVTSLNILIIKDISCVPWIAEAFSIMSECGSVAVVDIKLPDLILPFAVKNDVFLVLSC